MGKKSWTRRAIGIGIFVFLVALRGLGADNSVRALHGESATGPASDITAKFLAGLVAPATPVATSIEESSPWILHSTEMDRAWQRTGQRQLPAIANWAPDFLGAAYAESNTVFYMFSGPDFLYPHAFFPHARTYILCGAEPVGAVPDLSKIPPEALAAALANIRKSLESVLNWNFFITKDMKTDLTRVQLSGTLPLLYVFLARTGCTIDSVTPVTIDRTGSVSEGEKGEHAQPGTARVDGGAARVAGASGGNASVQTPGVKIVFASSSGSSQTLYYFCTDLSDDGVKMKPGFLRFCEQQGQGVSLLKAASYLMHEPGFVRVRDFPLAHSEIIVQDDSGIPLRLLQNWDTRYCGQYTGPIEVFKKYWQSDLADEYARNPSAPLPFGFGYQWQPNRSDLMILRRPEANISRARPGVAVPNDVGGG